VIISGFSTDEINNCKSWGNRYLQIGDKLLYEGHLVKWVIWNKINHYKSLGGVYFQIDDKLLYDGRIVKGLTLNEIKNFKRIPGNGQYSAKAGHKYLQGGRVVTGRKTWQ
jgi:hypothetical protein